MPDVGDILNKPIFGPRLLAMIGWMKFGVHCSYSTSTIETYMQDVLQVPVSRGYLAKLCTGLIADSLDKSYQELKDAIPQQEQLGSDETSFKNNGKKHWIWCIESAIFTVFHIAPTRSRKVLEELVGEEFAGYLNFELLIEYSGVRWRNEVRHGLNSKQRGGNRMRDSQLFRCVDDSFCVIAKAFGKVPYSTRVDNRECNLVFMQQFDEQRFITASSLHDNDRLTGFLEAAAKRSCLSTAEETSHHAAVTPIATHHDREVKAVNVIRSFFV